MRKQISGPRRAWIYSLVALALVAALFSPAAAQKKNEKEKNAAAKVPDLVWPLPPEKPRIRYLGSLSSNEDVQPPKKKGWLKKLINEEEARNVIGMYRPSGIAVDSKERVYISDTNKGAVFVFDLKNKTLNFLGAGGRGKLANPYGIAIDKNDNVYVADAGLKRVNVYDSNWNLVAAVAKVGEHQITNPAGVTVDDARGRLFIVDSRGHKVFVSDLNQLNKGTSFGKRGDGDGEFNFPSYVAVDKEGRVYVADTMNFCIKVFDKELNFIKRIGEHGTAVGMFDRPRGVAIDGEGNIYVVDASFSNFQIFNFDAQLLLFVGAFGTEPGYFRLPSGIFIDKQNRVYVSDQVNSRIQIFQFLGGN